MEISELQIQAEFHDRILQGKLVSYCFTALLLQLQGIQTCSSPRRRDRIALAVPSASQVTRVAGIFHVNRWQQPCMHACSTSCNIVARYTRNSRKFIPSCCIETCCSLFAAAAALAEESGAFSCGSRSSLRQEHTMADPQT